MRVAADPAWAPCGSCDCVDGRSPFPRWNVEGDALPSNLCPRQQVSSDSRAWLSVYQHYTKGHLLLRGAVNDQPALYLEAMTLIACAIEALKQEFSSNG